MIEFVSGPGPLLGLIFAAIIGGIAATVWLVVFTHHHVDYEPRRPRHLDALRDLPRGER